MKLSNLLNRDYRIVEKRKIFFLVPVAIVLIAAICMLVYGLTTGSPLNLGMDFQGGYTVNVKLSTKLTDETLETYRSQITNIVENLTDDEGNPYNIKISDIQRQGSAETASLYVKYKAVAAEDVMEEEINPAIQEALQDSIFKIVPVISRTEGAFTASYGSHVLTESSYSRQSGIIERTASANGVTVSDIKLADDGKSITFTATGSLDAFVAALADDLSISDKYSGQAVKGDIIGATVSSELLINAILAISLSIVLMLVYIAFRFEVSSGLSAIVALVHDIAIMFSFMAIFHIEINSTFIAALITILGYSINNTIIIFDRIRENVKSVFYKNSSAALIANRSIRETLMRSINTTVTTLVTILMVAIIGVPDIRIFAAPLIMGLLAGTYSSICISPSVWAMWKDRKKKKQDKKPQKADKTETKAVPA